VTGLLVGIVVLAVVSIVGTLGYRYIGQPTPSWVDSFYMTFITISTIGFGEVVDLTHHPLGRLFTVVVAVFGIGTLSYLFSAMVALLVDADLNLALKRRRMEKQIAKLSGHYIVCGIGRVGTNVADELIKTQREFVVIENNREVLDTWLEAHPHAFFLHDDASDDAALQRAGVDRAAGVFAVTGDDGHNLMVALSVKLLNSNVRVVVRLHDIRNEQKARRAGADEIVSPDFTGGLRIAAAMLRPLAMNFVDQMMFSAEATRVEEVVVPQDAPPFTLGELLPRSTEYLLLAMHERGQWQFNPDVSLRVQAGMVLVLMTTPSGRRQVELRVGASRDAH